MNVRGGQVEERRRGAPPGRGLHSPTRMNSAWLIEEQASSRFTSVCTMARIEPTEERCALPGAEDRRASSRRPSRRSARSSTRSSPANPAAFTPEAMNASDRRRRALVDVGRPRVERHGGDLEPEAHHQQGDAGEQHGGAAAAQDLVGRDDVAERRPSPPGVGAAMTDSLVEPVAP